MAKRKSNAQVKRLQKRAEARGETYEGAKDQSDDEESRTSESSKQQDCGIEDTTKQETTTSTSDKQKDDTEGGISKNELTNDDKKLLEKRTIAFELKKQLKYIEDNEEMKAKDRRSAKRKAEAIAVEKSGVASAQDLLDWLENFDERPKKKRSLPNRTTPNILFIGQLTFDTTKDDILQCFRKHLIETEGMTIADDVFTVRLLTHSEGKLKGKSKGMAFLEIKDSDPKIIFSCLKLHHTYLKGRRINVERTSGGGKATKQAKVEKLRKNQVDYMKDTVQAIIAEYDTSSLDEGVMALCERHNATIVHAAMERFLETDGPNKENPSAYLTALLQKLATEGIFDRTKNDGKQSGGQSRTNRGSSERPRSGSDGGRGRSSSGGGRGRGNVGGGRGRGNGGRGGRGRGNVGGGRGSRGRR